MSTPEVNIPKQFRADVQDAINDARGLACAYCTEQLVEVGLFGVWVSDGHPNACYVLCRRCSERMTQDKATGTAMAVIIEQRLAPGNQPFFTWLPKQTARLGTVGIIARGFALIAPVNTQDIIVWTQLAARNKATKAALVEALKAHADPSVYSNCGSCGCELDDASGGGLGWLPDDFWFTYFLCQSCNREAKKDQKAMMSRVAARRMAVEFRSTPEGL